MRRKQQPIICQHCKRAAAPTGRELCAECWDAESTRHRAAYLASLQNSEHERKEPGSTGRAESPPPES
jgi:hypothetical protein